jgi:DNA-binding NtrC family response regulator
MPPKVLLVGVQPNSAWVKTLGEALQSLGQLNLTVPTEAIEQLERVENYILIIVDAATTKGVPSLITALHRQRPIVPVVVVTDSPTWQRAREIFLAGATDYVRKSLDPDTLLEVFTKALYSPDSR